MAKGKGIKAGDAFIRLGLDDRGLQKGMRNAQLRMRAFRSIATQAGVAVTAALTPLIVASRHLVKFGDSITKMSRRVGVAVDRLTQLDQAMRHAGGSTADLETMFRALDRNMLQAAISGGETKKILDELGVSIEDLLQMGPEDRLAALADGLERVDRGLRGGIAQRLFGRSGLNALPFLEGGGDAFRRRVDFENPLITPEQAASAERLADAFQNIADAWSAILVSFGADFADDLAVITSAIADMTFGLRDLNNEWGLFFQQMNPVSAAMAGLSNLLQATGLARPITAPETESADVSEAGATVARVGAYATSQLQGRFADAQTIGAGGPSPSESYLSEIAKSTRAMEKSLTQNGDDRFRTS